MSQLEIDGIKYQEIERRLSKSSGRLNSIMLMAAAFRGLGGNGYSRPNPQVNIFEEYKLVKTKQSKLCRRDREYVEWAFKQLYKEVSE